MLKSPSLLHKYRETAKLCWSQPPCPSQGSVTLMSYLDNGKKMTGPRDDSDLALRRFIKATMSGQTGCIPGGLLDMVTSKPFLQMGCTPCHPRVLGSFQKPVGASLSAHSVGQSRGSLSPIQGLILTPPMRHSWQFSSAVGNML